MGIGVVDRVLNGRDLLRIFIGDLDAELVFESHHQLNRVQRIRTQISNKGLLAGDLRLFDTQLFCNDFLDARFNIAHGVPRRVVKESVILAALKDTPEGSSRTDHPA